MREILRLSWKVNYSRLNLWKPKKQNPLWSLEISTGYFQDIILKGKTWLNKKCLILESMKQGGQFAKMEKLLCLVVFLLIPFKVFKDFGRYQHKNMFTEVIVFFNTHFINFIRKVPPVLLRLAPYLYQNVPFSAPYFSLSYPYG